MLTEQGKWQLWRNVVAAWHPLPDAASCIMYLASEVGEVCDAYLRRQRADDDRTNARDDHLGRELAQVVDMAYAVAISLGINLDAECAIWRQEVYDRGESKGNPQQSGSA